MVTVLASDGGGLRIVELQEYGSTSEPVQLTAVCAATIAMQLSKFLNIAADWGAPNRYHLTARQHVGDIVIDDVHIRIRSAKASTVNLFWMLTYGRSDPAFRDALSHYAEDEGLFEYLVTVFARQVEVLIRGGLHHSYRTAEGTLPRMRGRLHIPRQIRQAAVHPERFALTWSEHSADILENRLLRGVVQRLAIVRFPNSRTLGHRLRRLLASIDHVRLVPISEHDFASVRPSRLTARYGLPLALGRLLWRHLHIRNEGGQIPFLTFLIDMNELFEHFVAAYLTEHLTGDEVSVTTQHLIQLDRHGLEAANVDLVLHHGRRPALVVDTKYKHYKGSPARDDLNQVFAYCHALGVPRGILLYPHARPLRDARHMPGATVEAWGIDLGGTVDTLRERMGLLAEELVNAGKHGPVAALDFSHVART